MELCKNCGSKILDDSSFCSNCGSTTDSSSNIFKKNIIKTSEFLVTAFLLDIIAIVLIRNKISITEAWIIAFIFSTIQVVIFYYFLDLTLQKDYEEYGLIQIVMPSVHFISLIVISMEFLNNVPITDAFGYIITSGVIIGAIHIFYRIIKYQSHKSLFWLIKSIIIISQNPIWKD